MALTAEDIAAIKTLLEPLVNKLTGIEVDLSAIKTHVHSINERLYKLEHRLATVEIKN